MFCAPLLLRLLCTKTKVLDLVFPSMILLGALIYYELRLAKEEQRSRSMLENILPRSIVKKIQMGVPRSQLSQKHENVTCFFSGERQSEVDFDLQFCFCL